jgi:hypothetical protein
MAKININVPIRKKILLTQTLNIPLCFHGDRVYRGWLVLGPAFFF